MQVIDYLNNRVTICVTICYIIPSGQLHPCGEGSLSMSSLCHHGFRQVSFINVVKAVSLCLHCATMDSFKSASSNVVKAVSLCLHCATMDVSLVLAGAAIAATSRDL